MMKYDPNLPAKTIQVKRRTGDLWQVPPWGYLEQIEIRWVDPIPNMDCHTPIEFLLERLPPGYEIIAKVRNVR